ncbi:Tyrosine-sulfated glycopeptide receptor 1 [Acorus gramineus]|uniref:Tyrosine-sulfated glycopeptide receptor 1 n=1 Tax=Acorus gramineus TaxID=55184 RepID=A0AAV9B2L3_ACOGR|nr:Tyrosine-sulfated glycopeptide receptor 1 [Acorus gramineus]
MIMKNHHFVFIVSFTTIAAALTFDGLSLLAFKSVVSEPLSALSDRDSSSGDPCHWSSVSCSNLSTSLRVVFLSLSSKNLSGYLPSEIAGLSFLRHLNEKGPLSEVVDPGLLGKVRVKKEVVAAFHVVMACVEVDPEARPQMKAVCDGLET